VSGGKTAARAFDKWQKQNASDASPIERGMMERAYMAGRRDLLAAQRRQREHEARKRQKQTGADWTTAFTQQLANRCENGVHVEAWEREWLLRDGTDILNVRFRNARGAVTCCVLLHTQSDRTPKAAAEAVYAEYLRKAG
jgi:hypothetical protein